MFTSGPMPGSCLESDQQSFSDLIELKWYKSDDSHIISLNYHSVFTFGHIHMGTVASGPSACCPLGLVGLCYTAPPFHYWGLVA